MKKTCALVILIFAAASAAYSQYYTQENMNWAFGIGAGVSFTTGSPVPFTSNMYSHEGCASVSDAAGNLLFYSNGQTVYERTGAIMPSGSGIVSYSTISTTQGVAIAPVIGNPDQYYVFSLAEAGGPGFLAWSIVDMTLNGGLGDVVMATRGTHLGDTLAEKMMVVAGDNCDIWLVAHRLGGQRFYAWDITAAGINPTPVVSTVGTLTGRTAYNSGVIKRSPDRKKIISVSELGTELYDFDAATGIISNCQVLGTEYAYGAEFSPDNTKLYILEQEPSDYLFQYDISLPNTPAIIASMTGLAPTLVATDLRLAPDSKIYMNDLSHFSDTYLDCIDFPNLPGIASHYVSHAVSLTYPGYIGLPSMYVSFPPITAGTITGDTILCMRDTLTMTDPAPGGVWSSADSLNMVPGGCRLTGMRFGQDTIYYVVSNGCISDTALHIVRVRECPSPGALQTPAMAGKELNIYPNPANNELNISAPYTITQMAISNLIGQKVYDKAYNSPSVLVDVTKFPAGVYLLKINGTEVRRFVKQ